jgi:hypothetical protein
MNIRYSILSCGLLVATLCAGITPESRAGIEYDFRSSPGSAVLGTIQTDIIAPAPGPITISSADVLTVTINPPPPLGPGGPLGGKNDPGNPNVFFSGTLTTTADLLSFSSGSVKIVYGPPSSGAAALRLLPHDVLYTESNPSSDFDLTGSWTLNPDSLSVLPEPSSLVMLATGSVVALGAWLVRHVRRPAA